MKKAGKIVIGLVCVGAFGVLMFMIYEKRRADRGRSEPDRRRPDTGDRKY